MIALVRSANDSSSDIAIYNKRAHGFLPKAPIKREKVINCLLDDLDIWVCESVTASNIYLPVCILFQGE